jgi:tetratricopeptide (TPR) repeat protein
MNADENDRRELFQGAQDLAQEGDYPRAKEALKEIVARWPNWPPGWHVLTVVTLKLGEVEDAIQYGYRSRELSPNSRKVSKILFSALWQATVEMDNAKFAYEAMIELHRLLAIRESPDHRNAALEIRQQFASLGDPGTRDGLLAIWDEQLAQFFETE